jgi:hypothetical protein
LEQIVTSMSGSLRRYLANSILLCFNANIRGDESSLSGAFKFKLVWFLLRPRTDMTILARYKCPLRASKWPKERYNASYLTSFVLCKESILKKYMINWTKWSLLLIPCTELWHSTSISLQS